jgi:outer membrane protein assembly factor BamB
VALALVAAAGCSSSKPTTAAFQPGSPWPKFRADVAQDGQGTVTPTAADAAGGKFWAFATGKGVFSSPVVGADGTVYIGSADQTFYALNEDGTVKWKVATGEIIDSAGLLDDAGHVYFGSGDGMLRAVDAASGAPVWTTPADPPDTNGGLINWFEGNVALSPWGELYVPNDNHYVYAVNRTTGKIDQRLSMPDQTWSAPAFSADHLYIGNDNLVQLLGSNLFAFDQTGADTWDELVGPGSVAASPLLLPNGLLVVGSFDGFVRAYDTQHGGAVAWEFGARDHLYASPARLPDGSIVQAGTDGTVYDLDDATGHEKWAFDIRDPIRSSSAVDAAGDIYFGAGDGRLYVLNPDGTLRWSVQLINDVRNDLNSSPALGARAIYLGGESGQVFSVPYDYCLHTDGKADPRCAPPPAALPGDGAFLLYTTAFGAEEDGSPASVDPNEPIALSLVVRSGGHNVIGEVDASAVTVTTTPSVVPTVDVSGNGQYLTLTPPAGGWTAASDGSVTIQVTAGTLACQSRTGLLFSCGSPGPQATVTLTTRLAPPVTTPFAIGPGTVWSLSRLSLPLPTLLPSYNQIGFDSLSYLVSVIETGGGHTIAWMAGAQSVAGQTVVDPTTKALLPLDVTSPSGGTGPSDAGFVTFSSVAPISVEVMNLAIPFQTFRMAVALASDGNASGPLRVTGTTVCGSIALYGQYLQMLGLCNPKTDLLSVVGAANYATASAGTPPTSTQLGTVSFASTASAVTVTLMGSQLLKSDHVAAILLIDPTTGVPVSLNYGIATRRTTDSAGHLATVILPLPAGMTFPPSVQAYFIIDLTPVANTTLAIP